MDKFYSHFDKENSENNKLLIDHLKETGEAARNYVLAVPDSVADKNELADLAWWIGILHDLGKFTSFFQDYLLHGNDYGEKKNHSLVGAIFAMHILHEKWQTKNIDNFTAMLLAFSCIYSHHSDLCDMALNLKPFLNFLNPVLRDLLDASKRRTLKVLFEDQLPDLRSQSSEIDAEFKRAGINLSHFELICEDLENHGSEFWKNFREAARIYKSWQMKKNLLNFNSMLYLLFSALIDADKRDAAKLKKEIERKDIPEDITIQFKKKINFGKVQPDLAQLRESLFQTLDEKAKTIDLKNHIFTITAPTGSGKTLAAFNFAMKLRSRIAKERGFLPRIIYALPFTSIIDQNYEVISNILSNFKEHQQNSAAYLLKHHHLTELQNIRFKNAENLPLDKLLLLVESWESEIIVTTFVQLFETLLGYKNKMLKKYHNLFGSIFLLDEVQNIPIEYWKLVKNVMKHLANFADCYFVLMTATQPLIFNPDESIELVDNHQLFFTNLDRVLFSYSPEKQKIDEFVPQILSLPEDKSAAVILNTIRSSLDLYNELANAGMDNLYYLSTNIVPRQRQERINEIQEKLKKNEPVKLISTQVIEAGVDFDFDIIYRDLAPIDSIVQAAGRANRNGLEDRGEVKIVSLANQNGHEFAGFIYGKGHLYVAKEFLSDKSKMSEAVFYRLVRESYEKLFNIVDKNVEEQIFEKWMRCGDFSAFNQFRLISGRFDYMDIFLELDEEAEFIWQQYMKNVFMKKSFIERKNSYLKIRSDFRKHIISIPEKFVKRRFWDYCGSDYKKIGYIPREEIEEYYDPETGFIREYDDETMIF